MFVQGRLPGGLTRPPALLSLALNEGPLSSRDRDPVRKAGGEQANQGADAVVLVGSFRTAPRGTEVGGRAATPYGDSRSRGLRW